MNEKVEEMPSLDYMSPIEAAKTLLQEAIALAEELRRQIKVLGETSEEREKTFVALEGLTPAQLREAAAREREYLGLHRFLGGGEEVKP